MTRVTRRTALTLAGSAAVAMPFIKRAYAEENTLNLYNWSDYIGENTIADFTKETGIKVNYDTYSSQEEMQAKLLAGNSGYDAVVMQGSITPRFVKAGLFEKLDHSKLPGWNNLDPTILKLMEAWAPANLYGLPYFWGSVGFTFNVDMVKKRIPDADFKSLDLIFKPEYASKLADCGISIVDGPLDMFPMVMRYLGLDADKPTPENIKKVVDLYKPVRKYIRAFDTVNYLNAIPNKELCVINTYSGDYATAKQRAKDAGVDINLLYAVPKTGAPIWVDCWCMLSDSKHKTNAYKFFEYLLQPQVIAQCTDLVHYANANLPSKKFVDPAILSDPAIYPDADTMKLLWAPKPLSDDETKALTRAFEQIKSG
ncbi:polyamine ABC transporter substrate-binding protein [Hyphomicrobium sp. MC1]|uniref:polyamine ABC transporter substrate-binding protein n=1 Tax=Hyphomicrobium sp. (strain MC1) TaxID=717785 RepID=UPI000213ED9A|nr:polyamine ABC transporter substrate-binding protein [Hyphomicrobium sp. MC1]CCB66650.1 Extracellular solute-binding protein family 1 [Hyphomicrobium sp. MC1]